MNNIKNIISNSISIKDKILNDNKLIETINIIVDKSIECLKKGNTIWWCGNGGSAADAQHLAAELSGRFYFDREPLSSEALHVNTSYLTAVANDYSYDVIYSRYLKGCGKKGDMIELSDYSLNVPSTDTPRIQESHIMLGHIICELIENKMFR